MSNAVATLEPRRSLIADMAGRYNMEPKAFSDAIRGTVVPKGATDAEFAAFLMVAKEYDLNPITKEIFAFPKQGGGIQPIVSVDGWANLINSHPQCDGVEFSDDLGEKGELVSITCKIFRKDRSHPTCATEYMSECKRDTSTWRQWPRRMLRHKALIQAARYAFGFAGVVDQDEAERIVGDTVAVLSPPPAPKPTEEAKAHILETIEAAPPAALSLDGEWANYFDVQKAELANAKTAHERELICETVHDAINGAVERAEITEATADTLRDRWEEIAQ